MQKLQELLDKHKNNIAKGYDNIEFRELYGGNFQLYLRNKPGDIDYISFCEILFNTPFLSLLEWRELDHAQVRQHYIQSMFREGYNDMSDTYHKINLALLESDKQRVEYIEANTI